MTPTRTNRFKLNGESPAPHAVQRVAAPGADPQVPPTVLGTVVRHGWREAFNTVYRVAACGHGIITPTDAAEHSIPAETLRTLAHRGTLLRVSQGVYRLKNSPIEGRTKLMALCQWPRACGWSLTGAAAIWVTLEVNGDERTWERMCPVVSLLVPHSYRTHRVLPNVLTLLRAPDGHRPQTRPPFHVAPFPDALMRCADELGKKAASSYYPDLYQTQVTRWALEMAARDLVEVSLINVVQHRFTAAYETAGARHVRS